MVCVKSFKLSLDDSILQRGHIKVNGSGGYFTICLHPQRNGKNSFIKCSKTAANLALTQEKIHANI